MRNEALIKARQSIGLTQRQVAERAHIPKVSYQRYEMGLREPKIRIANRIALILNSDPITLFGT